MKCGEKEKRDILLFCDVFHTEISSRKLAAVERAIE